MCRSYLFPMAPLAPQIQRAQSEGAYGPAHLDGLSQSLVRGRGVAAHLRVAQGGVARCGYDVIVVGVGGYGKARSNTWRDVGSGFWGLSSMTFPMTVAHRTASRDYFVLAYFEHPAYVPLLHRAYELWWALEREVQERLLIITGLTLAL